MLTATDATFAGLVTVPGPVLVDVFAPWCGNCRALARELAIFDKKSVVPIVKLDADACPTTADRLKVAAVPTLILFVDGVEKRRLVGFQPAARIAALVEDRT
jgi:thioredoxin 1